jgi:hypothetical protein
MPDESMIFVRSVDVIGSNTALLMRLIEGGAYAFDKDIVPKRTKTEMKTGAISQPQLNCERTNLSVTLSL